MLEVDSATSISEEGETFTDVTTGRFVEKTDVVRVEKKEDQVLIHFRNRMVLEKRNLKLCVLHDCTGVHLAHYLKKATERLDATSKDFLAKWGVQVDPRPVDMQLSFVDPGMLLLGKVEKSLNDIIFPVARNAYNNYYRQLFDTPFDLYPETDLVLVFAERTDRVERLRAGLDFFRESMNLKLKIKELPVTGNREETWAELFAGQLAREPVYLFVLQEPLPLGSLLEPLVRQGVLFDVLRERELSSSDQPQNEVTVLRHLGVICSKLRGAPWKLKNIPFGEMPLSVASLSFERKKNGAMSVALVFSLNAFLSKFVCDIAESQEDEAERVAAGLLVACLDRFRSLHRIYPVRLIVYVTGKLPQPVQALYASLRDRLLVHYQEVGYSKLSTLTLVRVSPSSSIQLYSQTNNAFISEDTVKEPGLLSYLVCTGLFSNSIARCMCSSNITNPSPNWRWPVRRLIPPFRRSFRSSRSGWSSEASAGSMVVVWASSASQRNSTALESMRHPCTGDSFCMTATWCSSDDQYLCHGMKLVFISSMLECAIRLSPYN